jgi:predicted DNA-binding transcriptional regulator AlpA
MDAKLKNAMETILDVEFGGDRKAMAEATGASVKQTYRWTSGDNLPSRERIIRLAKVIESEVAAVRLASCSELEIWQILEDY